MKLFNRIVGLTSAILVVAGGSAGATAFADGDTNPAAPYLQVADSVESTFDFNKADNQLTTYYQILVRAGNEAVDNVVVTPYFDEVQEGELEILDTDPAGFNATVNDNGTISIDHIGANETVGLRIAHTAVYKSAAALESAQEITHGVYAEGEDANGDPVHGKNPNADTTVCAVNETGDDSDLATDTDACDVLTQYVPHFRVNALAPKPVKDNGFPNEVKIETQVKLENTDSDTAYLAFKAIKGNDLLGYNLKDAAGNVVKTVEASDDIMDQGYYWIALDHMTADVVKTVDLHVDFQEKHAIQYEVRGVLDGLNNNVDECTLNYSLDSDADSCDSNAGHATLVKDKAPEITGYVNTDLSALNIPVDIGIDQLTEHADTVKAGNYDIHMDQVPDGVETKNDFTCSSDDLPEGLTVKTDLPNDQCVISGTPTKASKDTYSVTVKFAEGNSYIIPGKYDIEETAVPQVAPTAKDKPEVELPLKTKVPDTAPTVDLPADTVVTLKDQRLEAHEKCAADSNSAECATLKASIDELQIKLNKEIHAAEVDVDWFCTESAETFDSAKCADAKSLLEHLKDGLLTQVPDTAPVAEEKPEGVVPAAEEAKPEPAKPEPAKPELADTGAYTGPLVTLGGLVLLAGAGLIFVASKKQKDE